MFVLIQCILTHFHFDCFSQVSGMKPFPDSITFFLESCSLERQPEKTLPERVILLRILYSIQAIDTETCIDLLQERGVFVGTHDSSHMLHAHYQQKLTVMDYAATFELLSTIVAVDYANLMTLLELLYLDNSSQSPLLTLTRVFEELIGPPQSHAIVLIQIFFSLYNWECARDRLMSNIFFKKASCGNSQDLVMRVLGSQMSNARAIDIMNDVCIALQCCTFDTEQIDVSSVSQMTKDSSDSFISVQSGRFRISALRAKLLQNLDTSGAYSVATTWKPPALPLAAEVWNSISTAQQQLILFVTSIDPKAVKNMDDLITMIYRHHKPDSNSFRDYRPEIRDAERIAQSIFLVLLRISVSSDSNASGALFCATSFLDALFSSTLGINQLQSMSSTIKVQILLTAYLSPKIRQHTYFLITKHFNERAFGDKKHLFLPQNITTHVQEKIQRWIEENKFEKSLVSEILQPLCI